MAVRLAVLDPDPETFRLFRDIAEDSEHEIEHAPPEPGRAAPDLSAEIAVIDPGAFPSAAQRRAFMEAQGPDSVLLVLSDCSHLGELSEDERTRVAGFAAKPLDRRLAAAHMRDLERRHTEQKRREAALRAIPDLFFRISRDGRFVECQPRNHPALAHSPSEFLGRPIREFTPEPVAEAALAACREALRTQTAQRFTYPYDHPVAGERRYYEARLAASGHEEVVVLVRDITDLSRAQAELERAATMQKALASRILHVQESERHHLARELHDAVGQMLLVHKLEAEWLAANTGSEEARDASRALARGLEQTMSTVRHLARGLRPPALDDFGLIAALEALAKEVSERSGLSAEVCARVSDAALSSEVAIALYRIAQEAISNAMKHAACRHIWITLSGSDGGALELRVEDDGAGIRPSDARARKSLGLLGMHERAATYGGDVRTRPRPSGGTAVVATLPGAAARAEESATA